MALPAGPHEIFVSYSSKDQAKANEICSALERAGVRCWIAPRDITPGSQWGGSIVGAIQASRAVLVVFSEAANASPQVVREMEIAVANRVPLIPVRVADAMPTEDMQFFLGVSHWFDAYPQPLSNYLPEIVDAVKRVLAREAVPWRRFARRLPTSRVGQIALGGGVAVIAALVVVWLTRPANFDPMAALRSPMAGRWQADIQGAGGGTQSCVFDVQAMGQASFSDDCPQPLSGARGPISVTRDGTFAPGLFHDGSDTGTFLFQGGGSLAGAFAVDDDTLVTRDALHGEIRWAKTSSDAPMGSDEADVLPQRGSWPLSDVPGIARRAVGFARAHWKPDAVLLSIDAQLMEAQSSMAANFQTADGPVLVKFGFYSPSTQQGMSFMPNSLGSSIYAMGAVDWRSQRPLPDKFIDLPAAFTSLRSRGMRGMQVKEAQLQDWGSETTAGDARLSGIEWMIDSSLDERGVVPAAE